MQLRAATSSALPLAPPARSDGRLPSLDGLRAVSILLVMVCHVARTANSPVTGTGVWYAWQGAVGVDMFFAISGFLITTLLLRERERTGTISLRGFYIRRAIRILPAFLVYLGAMAILQQLGWIRLVPQDWLGATTYTVNFLPHISRPLHHIWSLSVEEHFYLLWPPLLLILGVRRAGVLALVCLMAEPAVRWCTYRYAGRTFDIDFVTFARLDAIAVGCLLAILAGMPKERSALKRLDARPGAWFFGALGVLALSVLVLGHSGMYTIVARHWVDALAIGVMIWTATRFPATGFGRVLNWTPLVWVGRLSYSLYLWQQVFLDDTNGAAWFCRFPQNLVLCLPAAMASYYLIERPFLALKPRPSRGRPPVTRSGSVVIAGPLGEQGSSRSPDVQLRVWRAGRSASASEG